MVPTFVFLLLVFMVFGRIGGLVGYSRFPEFVAMVFDAEVLRVNCFVDEL